jgi:hypothetical protein
MVKEDTTHQCHFCGTYVREGYEHDFDERGNRKRHWLSDCRPDLVEHEIGELCTWTLMAYSTPETPHTWDDEKVDKWNIENKRPGCYAYQDRDGNYTTEHIHFHKDGPM